MCIGLKTSTALNQYVCALYLERTRKMFQARTTCPQAFFANASALLSHRILAKIETILAKIWEILAKILGRKNVAAMRPNSSGTEKEAFSDY